MGRTSKLRLDAVVKQRQSLSWSKARDYIASGKIWIAGRAATDPGELVEPAVEFELRMNTPRAKAAAATSLDAARIVFQDSQLVVVNKPAGINTVPFDEAERDSLEQLVSHALGQRKLVIVHRVDRETSGLVAFARTKEAGENISLQFRRHTVVRRYFALAQGVVTAKTIRTTIADNRGDGLRGSVRAEARPDAKPAVTHVTPLLELDGMTLVECRLETGRTHQIRIHLAEDGHPLLGEKAYNRYHEGPQRPAPRLMLHAGVLGLTHPTSNEPARWTTLPPDDFLDLVETAGREAISRQLIAR